MMRLGIQKTINVKKKKKKKNYKCKFINLRFKYLPHGKIFYLFAKNVSFYLQKKQH